MGIDQNSEVKHIAETFKISEKIVKTQLETRSAPTMSEKLKAFENEKELIEAGDPKAVEKQHAQGKLKARERIAKIFDPDSFEELDQLHRPYETGFDIGEDKGRSDGVIIGYGTVHDRPVTLWAQDISVLGGTMGTVHARKIAMIMDNAINARTPIVQIYDSEGVRFHDAIQYPDNFSAGAIARFQTIASGVVPKISLVMGPCLGDLSIVAGLSDFIFMVKNSSYLQLMSNSASSCDPQAGSAEAQARITGVCDVLAENDEDCLKKCAQLLGYLPSSNEQSPLRVMTGDDPNRRAEELMNLVPLNSSKPYSMHKLISLITDNGEFFEIKSNWTKNLITGFARFDGYSTGIIANNPKDKAGCMTLDAADKMSRFVRFCDAFNIPLIYLADNPGFLPDISEETRGLIRHGARMIQANSEASVPQICLTVRKIYGGGRLAMVGQALGADMDVAWPTHEPGLMGAEGGAAIIYRNEFAAIKDEAQQRQKKNERLMELQWGLDSMVREATQKIIDPRDTRPFLIRALNWLRNKKPNWPPRKHENFRM